MRIFLSVFLMALTAAGPALAEWRFRTSGTTASIWTRNDDGTSLAMNCVGDAEGRLKMDLTVAPVEGAPQVPASATFQVGGFSVDMGTEPYGPEGQRLQILRLDEEYAAADITELRRQIAAGSRLNVVEQSGFQATSFSLSGSGRAIAQLEEACENVWEIARNLRGG